MLPARPCPVRPIARPELDKLPGAQRRSQRHDGLWSAPGGPESVDPRKPRRPWAGGIMAPSSNTKARGLCVPAPGAYQSRPGKTAGPCSGRRQCGLRPLDLSHAAASLGILSLGVLSTPPGWPAGRSGASTAGVASVGAVAIGLPAVGGLGHRLFAAEVAVASHVAIGDVARAMWLSAGDVRGASPWRILPSPAAALDRRTGAPP